tara:strand:+ start:1171 stop:1680 length:510 start_codon:yes stop_codon:yes gene_type:complete
MKSSSDRPSWQSDLKVIQSWREAGEKIVFTNGVFDILHVGHVTYLDEAKKRGHRLVLGLNSDSSVRRLNKAPNRPIHTELDRKRVLQGLRAVDLVLVFDEDTPLDLIASVQPDVLVKGGDYDPSCTDANDKSYIVGSQEVMEAGGLVAVLPFVPGHSTTGIIEKSRTTT